MDGQKEKKYFKLLEKLIDHSSRATDFSRETFVGYLDEFCELFHLEKGVTEFYLSPKLEAEKKGEILIDRDTGKGEKVLLRRRVITPASAVIIGTLYVANDAPPFPDDELEKIDIVLRMILAFVARNRLQRSVYQLAFYDSDNYPNLRTFLRYVEGIMDNGQLYGNTVLCFNLKHFSLINQDIGRNCADVALRSFFNRLEKEIGDQGVICRMGGDNFIMIFQSSLQDSVLKILAGTPVTYSDDPTDTYRVILSARAGVFPVPEGYKLYTPGQIMETVYPSVQLAKMQDDDVVFYDENLFTNREKVLQVRRRFQSALTTNEFHAFYQPKVNVHTGEIVGAEALCRWNHSGTWIMPMDFIPVLEMNMDICKLDFCMLDVVCRDIRRWLDEGRQVVRISVNLSRKNLVDADLLTHILEVIDRHQVPHDYIEIELTETTTDVAFRDLTRVVTGLQQNGISTSVDDFGNGYSSLNLIRTIPWNVLKIDRSLLPIGNDNEAAVTSKLYKHVVAIARDIGIDCITEGVETKKQIEILRENNCPIAQGFYFDMALPVDEFEKRLDRNPYPEML